MLRIFRLTQREAAILRSVLLLSAFASSLHALDPNRALSQLAHTAWRMDGFGSPSNPIAQTEDGFIWFGTSSGLLRFDGSKFVLQTDLNSRLPNTTIECLEAASDGSLWIGTNHGLSRWRNDKLTNYSKISGFVTAILEAKDRNIWFINDDLNDHKSALCVISGNQIRCRPEIDGVVLKDAMALAQDADGALWTSSLATAVHWSSGVLKEYRPKIPRPDLLIAGIKAIAPTVSGAVWVGLLETGSGLGLQRLTHGTFSPFLQRGFDSSTLPVHRLLVDREGSLWIGTDGMGVYRINGSKVDHLQKSDGLTSDSISDIYEDREGNLWFTSNDGVDCFRETPVVTFYGPTKIGVNEADGISSSQDGTIWVSRPGSLGGIRDNKVFSLKSGRSLPGKLVTSVFEDHTGRMWVGIDRGLWVYSKGIFREITTLNRAPLGLVTGITEDVDNTVWAEVIGPPRTLFHIRDLQVKEAFAAPGIPAARKVAADPQQGIWLGLMDGNLAHYRKKGELEIFSYPNAKADTSFEQLSVNPDGTVLGSTLRGVIAWRRGTERTLTVTNGLPCNEMFAHTFDKQDSLWLYTACGLIQITDKELERWWQQPNVKLRFRLFDSYDGAHPGRSFFNGATRTPDGRLWFVNNVDAQMIDPAHIPSNRLAPPVRIEGLIADRRNYSTSASVHLPPLTRDLEIRYAGLSFAVPEKVRFRYKLEHHDVDWQDPGTRREAFYSNLEPGEYAFRVVACNNDGVWNEKGATLDFHIAPAWYQTNWFRVSNIVCFALLLWAVYQIRLQQITKEFQKRTEASVEERTRIARELHDTLLQSLHGVLFRFQAARNMLPLRAEEAMKALDGAIMRTEQTIAESRDAIKDLRMAATTERDIAESITALGQELTSSLESGQIQPAFSVTIEGEARSLSPIVLHETRQIAHEVLTNAFRHAEARRIEAEIRFDRHALRLRFRDDGRGIDPEVLKTGSRPGHWGLLGIRERAQRMGATLDFWSEAGAGTEVELVIPALVAYEKSRDNRFWRLGRRGKDDEQRSKDNPDTFRR